MIEKHQSFRNVSLPVNSELKIAFRRKILWISEKCVVLVVFVTLISRPKHRGNIVLIIKNTVFLFLNRQYINYWTARKSSSNLCNCFVAKCPTSANMMVEMEYLTIVLILKSEPR